jgi:carbamoyltransferase
LYRQCLGGAITFRLTWGDSPMAGQAPPEWHDKIPAVVHVDGTARIQTVDDETNPGIAALLGAFESRTGVPLLVNTSLNTAGRPMVDDPRDALELFGSAPVDAMVMGPHLIRRSGVFAEGGRR